MSHKKTKIIFLRHADTEKDPTVNASLWGLSENGYNKAVEVSKSSVFDDVDLIFASEERKTFLTAEHIAKRLSKEIVKLPYFNEVKRGDKFLTKEEFEVEKDRQLGDLSYMLLMGNRLWRHWRGLKPVFYGSQRKI